MRMTDNMVGKKTPAKPNKSSKTACGSTVQGRLYGTLQVHVSSRFCPIHMSIFLGLMGCAPMILNPLFPFNTMTWHMYLTHTGLYRHMWNHFDGGKISPRPPLTC